MTSSYILITGKYRHRFIIDSNISVLSWLFKQHASKNVF